MSDKFIKVLQAIIDKELLQIQVSFVAKIVSFDKSKMTAEISPLLKTSAYNGNLIVDSTMQNIKDVRIERIPGIRPIYKMGDLVKVECSTSPIDGAVENGLPINILGHKYSISFVTIKGRLNPKTFTPPTQYGDAGLIINDDPNFYLSFKSDQIYAKGKTVFNDNIEVKGNSRSFVTHGELQTFFNTFKAAYDAAVVAGLTIAGIPPNPASPAAFTAASSAISMDISSAKTDNIKTGAG